MEGHIGHEAQKHKPDKMPQGQVDGPGFAPLLAFFDQEMLRHGRHYGRGPACGQAGIAPITPIFTGFLEQVMLPQAVAELVIGQARVVGGGALIEAVFLKGVLIELLLELGRFGPQVKGAVGQLGGAS